MPWTPADAHKHHKGLSEAQARKWATVANAAREEYHDDGRAIATANAAVDRKKRHPWGGR